MPESGIAESRPIIIIGRGGSGTRLVSDMVNSLGVFLGNDLNISFDSVEWVEKIYALSIEKVTAGIENSSPRDVYWQDAIRGQAQRILKKGARIPSDLWGWKLPETTLIVSEIIRYFPQARFIHLIRHPVTSCCRRSHMTSRLDNPIGAVALPAAYDYIGRPRHLLDRDPIHIHNAASWVFQVEGAISALETVRTRSAVHMIKFEELCEGPARSCEEINNFLRLPKKSEKKFQSVDKDRAKAIVYNKDDAVEVWRICAATAKKLNYSWP